MNDLTHDIDKAVRRLREKLDAVDEQIATLNADIPGDPGDYRWPGLLEDALDLLHDERLAILRQLAVLLSVRKSIARPVMA